MAGKKVLVVDDEKLIVKGIRFSLEQDNMEVDCAYDGEEALQMAHNKEYDIILLDVMLPKLTGFEVCQQIREFSNVPVIMLTAKGDDMDKILGLEYGADDYITKPFNILEVKARIKAIFRRMEPKKGTTENTGILESGDMKLDRDGKRAYIQGREIGLTAKEFEVLELLMLNPDKVYSRENLLKLVWGTDYPGRHDGYRYGWPLQQGSLCIRNRSNYRRQLRYHGSCYDRRYDSSLCHCTGNPVIQE